MNKKFYVAKNGCDFSDGSSEHPFLTINKAAKTAETGDRIIVHEGEYREWVKPFHSGSSDICRIIYEAAKGEKVVIKGSERIQNWEKVEGTVWRTVLPNAMFGEFNPYQERLEGDWLIYPQKQKLHLGDVYLNGKSFYEALNLDEVKNPVKRTVGYHPDWTKRDEMLLEPEQSVYKWYAEIVSENTIIYANFHGVNPNVELVEINVRKCCFYPEKTGINYITVRGFEIMHAACPWAPPTADQPGMLGVHWSKGWVIEKNILHDAKCSALSIGKEASTGHNLRSRRFRKSGYQYQMEAVYRALQSGWSKEKIGSHIIRDNEIYDCGQNGIVGHMGGAFSEIYNNHIYRIGVKHEFFGHEIAGIKLHAAIDTQIYHNNIHDCTLGTWMDWEAQGVRISRNLYYKNNRDLMIEVTHGPHLVDNNIFASQYNLDNVAQGGAYVHNLFCGSIRREAVYDRTTPYHFPHTTEVAGCAFVYGSDDRFYQNIFVGGARNYSGDSFCGTASYNGCPASIEEFISITSAYSGDKDKEPFVSTRQPAYIDANIYLNGAEGYEREQHRMLIEKIPEIEVIEENNQIFLKIYMDGRIVNLDTQIIDTEKLGMVRIVEGAFDTPDGNLLTLNMDYFNKKRRKKPAVGPFEGLKPGVNKIKVWG